MYIIDLYKFNYIPTTLGVKKMKRYYIWGYASNKSWIPLMYSTVSAGRGAEFKTGNRPLATEISYSTGCIYFPYYMFGKK
jgi:hypothetical protein